MYTNKLTVIKILNKVVVVVFFVIIVVVIVIVIIYKTNNCKSKLEKQNIIEDNKAYDGERSKRKRKIIVFHT